MDDVWLKLNKQALLRLRTCTNNLRRPSSTMHLDLRL